MMSPLRVAVLMICAVTALAVQVCKVHAVTVGPGTQVLRELFPSAAMVNGRPAVAWSDPGAGEFTAKLTYVRAENASGEKWGTPIVVDQMGVERRSCLRMVDGNPAICYTVFGTEELRYARAADPAGQVWNTPVVVASGNPGGFTFYSMEIVDGKPAICFVTGGIAVISFIRAKDSHGQEWEPPTIIRTPGSPEDPEFLYTPVLKVVQDRPAIAYISNAYSDDPGLWYLRALDSTGSTWSVRQKVASDIGGGSVGSISLLMVDGMPALGYRNAFAALQFIRASAADGSAWHPPITLENLQYVHANFAVVNERPSVAFQNTRFGGPFIQYRELTNDADGGETWSSPVTLAGGYSEFQGPPSHVLFEVNGRPACVFHHARHHGLEYLRALDDSPPRRWPVELRLEKPDDTLVDSGASVDLGIVVPGRTLATYFKVRNPFFSTLALHGLSFRIDGPDAQEFSVTSPPASLAGGQIAELHIAYAPATVGIKRATLHLVGEPEDSFVPWRVELTGRFLPGMRDAIFTTPVPATRLALQGDGKILVFGADELHRLTSDGILDLTFFSPALGGRLECIAVQKDGGILIGGDFEHVGGRPRSGLARLNPDGSVDNSFVPATSSGVRCVALLPGGKILAGGTGPELIRLFPDGSLDPEFNASPNGGVFSLALQSNDKLIVGGQFSMMGSVPARRISRLLADGTPEAITAEFSDRVNCLAVLTDGRILAGTSVVPDHMARLFSDGSFDIALPVNGEVVNLVVQTDGKCLAGGTFSKFGGVIRNGVARINPDGSLDTGFEPLEISFTPAMAVQADGKVLVAGRVNPGPQLVRLANDVAFSRVTTEGDSTARWLRGGAAPEVRDVTFDLKPDTSSSWLPLGTAHRISGGWELKGLTLPAFGILRAQGYAGGSVIESRASLSFESWRRLHFNTSSQTGDSADNADPDHDGLTNFAEFAFGLDPMDSRSSVLPEFKLTDGMVISSFPARDEAQGVIFRVQRSPSMEPGAWISIPDTGTGGMHVFKVLPGERVFVRYAVEFR